MTYKIVMATEDDRKELLALYRVQIGREGCPWDDEYPSNASIDFDLSRDALFVLKEDGKIKAAVSLDDDEEVNRLKCWDKKLSPMGELSRLCVLPGEQNKGLARLMMQFGMYELKRRGYRGIHILVNKYNKKAIRSYAVFGFGIAGECHMYDQDFICYEREL
ncbi:MAG: GNAT family N-acetyltransferase [Lachnospiraceae bacterium]|nr:GNAT family N-acetyltransferase [Lachnospiraceae bacterium]